MSKHPYCKTCGGTGQIEWDERDTGHHTDPCPVMEAEEVRAARIQTEREARHG